MIRLKLFTGIIRAWQFVTQGRCKYYSICSLKRDTNIACTKNRGQFYGFGRYPGCYREHEKTRGKE
jgi:hypothetical protein